MKSQLPDFLPCTVVVASFTPESVTSVAISGAFWWPYNGLVDTDSNMNLLVNGTSFGVNGFNMKTSSVDFTFSGYGNISNYNNNVDIHEGEEDRHVNKPGPVLPTIFTLNAYIGRDSSAFSVRMTDAGSIIGRLIFNGVSYSLGAPIDVDWPK